MRLSLSNAFSLRLVSLRDNCQHSQRILDQSHVEGRAAAAKVQMMRLIDPASSHESAALICGVELMVVVTGDATSPAAPSA